MTDKLAVRIGVILDREPPVLAPLHGGMIGQVYAATWPDGMRVVVKADPGPESQLDIEGYMLRYLAEQSTLPVPALCHCSRDLLIMEYVAGSSRFDATTETHAAELLAALHAVHAPAAGLERDTLIGALPQPNPWSDSWVDFFGEQRLLHLARLGVELARMPVGLLQRVERLCRAAGRLYRRAGPALAAPWRYLVIQRVGREWPGHRFS